MEELFKGEGISKLKELDLGYSNLNEIPNISRLGGLETLDLSYTEITDISSLQANTTLKNLLLKDSTNKLEELVDFKKLPTSLEKIIYSRRDVDESEVEISKEQINARRVSS